LLPYIKIIKLRNKKNEIRTKKKKKKKNLAAMNIENAAR
jgi:hypothetical protein